MTPALLSADAVRAKVRDLPVLPQAIVELTAAIRRDDVSLEQVVTGVSRDPALAAKALRWANSSFYGVCGRVSTVREAVNVLGLQTVSAMATTAAVMASLGTPNCRGFDLNGAWRHAISTALCSRALAQALELDDESAFTAGLLHDVGELALAVHFPTEMNVAQSYVQAQDVPPLLAEAAVLGFDHAAVGGIVATHWRFGADISQAIALHHELPPAEATRHGSGGMVLADVVHVADTVCHALDLRHDPQERVPQLSLAAWERIGLPADTLLAIMARTERQATSLFDALDL